MTAGEPAPEPRRHPWNAGFTWADRDTAPTTCSPEQVAQFDRDGYVVLEGAFTEAELAPVLAELDGLEAEHAAFYATAEGGRFGIAEAGAITFSPHLVRRSATLRAFVRHPVLLGLCADLVGPDVHLYWDQAVYKYPEKPRRFPWHQDNGYAFVEPQQYLTCWIALTDATEDNGCPRVAPGLHRLGTLQHRYVEPLGFELVDEPSHSVAAPVGAGGIVVFSSLTPHLTGPNTTGDVRKAYIVQYAPAGAVRLEAGADGGIERIPADDPERQFAVLRAGAPA